MAQVNVTVDIHGWDQSLVVKNLSLRQSYNQHHTFELLVNPSQDYILSTDKVKAILGEAAIIKLQLKEKGKEHIQCHFRGFVDAIDTTWASQGRVMQIKGYSPSIFMDCAPRFRTFYEQPLSTIIRKITSSYNSTHLPPLNQQGTGNKLHYSVQAQETDYSYLCRLAAQTGKVFFYDGEKYYFAELADTKQRTIVLEIEKDIQQANISLNLSPLSFRLGAYELEKSEMLSCSSHNQCNTTHPLANAVANKSSCYPNAEMHFNHLVKGLQELQKKGKHLLSGRAHELVQLRGVTNHPGLKIGSKIYVKGSKDMISSGEYLITQLQHSVGSDHAYRNSFTAVPAGFPFSTQMHRQQHTKTGPLMGIVKATNDPEKLGRVRVQFLGDEEKTLSPWLRVLVPYTKYGGMFFKPGIGDQVVVFCEDLAPENLPFVMGAFFHGKAKADHWHDPDNKLKGIATEKIQFLFNDRNGKLKISADEIEFIARQKITINGGHQLTQQASRIDLNP